MLNSFSPEFALVLYTSAMHPCMEYYCHVWTGTPSCYLGLLFKVQKQICRTVGSLLAAFLESLAHHRNVARLSLFYRCYLGRCSWELAQLVAQQFSWGRSTHYSDRFCMIFLSLFLDVTRMYMSKVSFLAQLDSGIFSL